MTELRIIKGDCWYSKMAGKKFPILGFSPTLGFKVLEDETGADQWYVKTSDCEIDETPKELEQELLIKLIHNSEGKCVDFPVKLEQGDWIDLRACTEYERGVRYDEGEYFIISFGLAIKLPEGYEAYILPRSSLFKKYGLMLVNSQGVIDNAYMGNDDIWMGTFVALRDGEVPFNERICQFRIQKNQPALKLTQVDNLEGINRGGFGEGTKNEKL